MDIQTGKWQLGKWQLKWQLKWQSIGVAVVPVVVAAMLSISDDASAQCQQGNENSWVTPTAPLNQFIVRDDGTVMHNPSRLVWQRCALGQSWNGSGCDGVPLMLTWSEALQAAQDHVQADREDWRLPNRNELDSIIESRCFLPALDESVFPDAPAGGYWTSSPVSDGFDESWITDFDDGLTEPAATGALFSVRLVRKGWE